MSKYLYREAIFVTKKRASLLADLSLEQFERNLKEEGYFTVSTTNPDLILKSSIDSYLKGIPARPYETSEYRQKQEIAQRAAREEQEKIDKLNLLNENIAAAFIAKQRYHKLLKQSNEG